MKLEQQVCNLEQARELKELGVSADCLFVWRDCNSNAPYADILIHKTELRQGDILPAYTVAELGEMLPSGFIGRQYLNSVGEYGFKDYERLFINPFIKNEAQARAAMLIYLLKNNRITIDDINKQ